jgi:hypothetical protein
MPLVPLNLDTPLVDELAGDAERKMRDEVGVYDFRQEYWLASPFYSDTLAAEVCERWRKHALKWTGTDPLTAAVWAAYRTYHGLTTANVDETAPTVSLTEAGDEGEFLALAVNHFRGLVRHQVALVTAERPAWDPQARTSSAESAKQVRLTRNLLDYVMGAKRVDQKIYDQLELAVVAGSAFCAFGWDAAAGLDGEGDLTVSVKAPWETYHEDVRDYADCKIHIYVDWHSRWDWVAHFAEADPEKAAAIKALDPDKSLYCGVQTHEPRELSEADRIPVLTLLVAPSKSCPKGRLAVVASPNLVLLDGPMPYGATAPITRICAAEFLGTSKPIANSWSQLPLMEAFNAIVSVIMTRADLGGVPDIAVPRDTEYEQGTFGGANKIEADMANEGKPTLIDLLQIPEVLAKLCEALKGWMEELSGINSVTRGNPSSNITSGSMAALIATQAVQFNSADERAYTFALEAAATHILRIYQRCASEEQLISIAGEDERWAVQSFRGDDLNQILRVAVKRAAPFMKTLAGRKEIADQLLVNKMIQDPREYIAVIENGELSPLFKGPVDQLTMIKTENQRIRDGEDVPVLLTDNHELHIREHLCELDTDARNDPAFLQRMMRHINGDQMSQGHFLLWQKASMETPDMCVAFGYRPLPMAASMAQAAMQMMGAPGGQLPGPTPPQKLPNAPEPEGKPPGPPQAPKGQAPSQGAPSAPLPGEAPAEAPAAA